MKFNLRYIILLLSFYLTLTTLFSQSVLGDNEESVENSQQQKISFNLPTPPSRGIPLGRHKGGGSRSSCQDYQNLTALVPVNNKIVWGKTIATHPEFLFYLPQGSAMEFVLQDQADNYIYRTNLQVPSENQGIFSIAIPKTATPLEKNKIYQWTLSLSCDINNPGAFVYVQGSIEKVALEPKIQTQLPTADNTELAVIYAREGIWYDAIALLAQLRRDNPNDNQINTMWSELLEQVNLTEMSSQPMLNW
ncbi:MAG: DUF928 domain-containing protein [Xenococcaceae cyanobacterium MO_234.B1]|nr:DUF928 domain-containing protein [Xenococcaceae cyanobacterium MO_234.B1]